VVAAAATVQEGQLETSTMRFSEGSTLLAMATPVILPKSIQKPFNGAPPTQRARPHPTPRFEGETGGGQSAFGGRWGLCKVRNPVFLHTRLGASLTDSAESLAGRERCSRASSATSVCRVAGHTTSPTAQRVTRLGDGSALARAASLAGEGSCLVFV